MKSQVSQRVLRPGFILLALCMTISAWAQQKVSGTITSAATRQPVIGATVAVKGTKVVTSTSSTGEFSLTLPAGKTRLVISSVGYETQELEAGTSGVMEIPLKEASSVLNDVVVTGYTSQRKKDVTGSVTVVNVTDMNK